MLVRELLFQLGFDSKAAERNAKGMDRVVGKLKKNLVRMGAAAVASAAAVGITGAKIIDEYTMLESRIKLVTDGLDGLRVAQEGVFDIAQKTGTIYSKSSDLYIRLARSTRAYGYEQNQVLEVTEAIQKAMVVSGDASSPGAAAALFQLGQGLQSGTLRGQELNSVLEQAPRLAEAIADGMGIKLGDLRKTAEAGEITAQVVMDALLNQAQTINKEFTQMSKTQAQSKNRLSNAYKKLVFELSKEADVQKTLVGFWDDFRKIVESENFKKTLKFLIVTFKMIATAVGLVIIAVTDVLGVIMDAIGVFGDLEDSVRLMGSAFLALAIMMKANVIAGFLKLIATVLRTTTVAWLLNGALALMNVLLGFITLPILLAVAAFVGLVLIIEDLWTYLQGGDSIIGRIINSFKELGKVIKEWLIDYIVALMEDWDRMMTALGKLRDSNWNPLNWFGGSSDDNKKKAAGALAGGSATTQNSQKNEINITVPPGSNYEQSRAIASEVENAVSRANAKQMRQARNDFPEVE